MENLEKNLNTKAKPQEKLEIKENIKPDQVKLFLKE